jgi:hypothetical protein
VVAFKSDGFLKGLEAYPTSYLVLAGDLRHGIFDFDNSKGERIALASATTHLKISEDCVRHGARRRTDTHRPDPSFLGTRERQTHTDGWRGLNFDGKYYFLN